MRCAFIITLVIASAAQAEEARVTLQSTVSGNQEQPKVMYIVPWQQPATPEFDQQLQSGIAAQLFTPMDRDEFVRELAYRDMLDDGASQQAASDATQPNNIAPNDH